MNNLVYGANNTKTGVKSDDTFQNKYGFKKLEDKLKKAPTEYSILTQGIDLTTFGLNLSSDNDIINEFGSPFDIDGYIPFQCTLPKCYTKKSNDSKKTDSKKGNAQGTKIYPKLTDKTLIYTFYNVNDNAMKLGAIHHL